METPIEQIKILRKQLEQPELSQSERERIKENIHDIALASALNSAVLEMAKVE